MREFFKNHNITNKLFALFLAACLWLIVMNNQQPEISHIYRDIPIQILGEDAILENEALVIIDGQNQKLSLKLKGRSMDMSKVKPKDIVITVDISEAKESGKQEFRYTLDLPTGISVDNSPKFIEFTLDKLNTKSVPVSLSISSDAPEGYLYGTPHAITESVTVKGPETILSQIQTAKAIVPTDGLYATNTLSCTYTLIDAEGNEVSSPYVTLETNDIQVKINVYKIATIPLRVKLVPGEDVTADMASVTISPSEIQVYGAEEDIRNLRSIQLATIDLATEQTGAERMIEIPLPDGIKLMPNQEKFAAVTLQIDGMGSKTLKISDIQLIDMNTSETKPVVQLAENQIAEVVLRGKKSVLTAITTADIRVTASFDSSNLVEGQNQVPITVTLLSYNDTITLLSYTAEITVEVVPFTPDVIIPPPDEVEPPVQTDEPQQQEQPAQPIQEEGNT